MQHSSLVLDDSGAVQHAPPAHFGRVAAGLERPKANRDAPATSTTTTVVLTRNLVRIIILQRTYGLKYAADAT